VGGGSPPPRDPGAASATLAWPAGFGKDGAPRKHPERPTPNPQSLLTKIANCANIGVAMAKVVYRKAYRMRKVGQGGVEATIPKEVVEKAARERELTVDEFIKNYRVVHLFDDFKTFDGAYRFEPAPRAEELEEVELR